MTLQAFVGRTAQLVAEAGIPSDEEWCMFCEVASSPSWPEGATERAFQLFRPDEPDWTVELRRFCRDFDLRIPPQAAHRGREQMELI